MKDLDRGALDKLNQCQAAAAVNNGNKCTKVNGGRNEPLHTFKLTRTGGTLRMSSTNAGRGSILKDRRRPMTKTPGKSDASVSPDVQKVCLFQAGHALQNLRRSHIHIKCTSASATDAKDWPHTGAADADRYKRILIAGDFV